MATGDRHGDVGTSLITSRLLLPPLGTARGVLGILVRLARPLDASAPKLLYATIYIVTPYTMSVGRQRLLTQCRAVISRDSGQYLSSGLSGREISSWCRDGAGFMNYVHTKLLCMLRSVMELRTGAENLRS